MAQATVVETKSDLEASFSDSEFRFFASLVYEKSGIVIGDHKKNMMFSRLVRRVRQLGLASFKDYCAFIKGPEGDSEIGAFINAMTTNLTKFFREDHHFQYLEETLIPVLLARQRTTSRRLRIWSAGCSSGEEPYTIAICLQRAIPRIADWDVRVLATDLDTTMVERGRHGSYPRDALSSVPVRARDAFFGQDTERPGHLVAGEALKSLIAFKPLNLLGPWPMSGPFDAIFCRNVMIYFDGPTKSKLVRRLTDMLSPDGWLFVGHSETLLEHQAYLALRGRTMYQRIKP